MAFHDLHSPSRVAKAFVSASVLAGTLVSASLTFGYSEMLAQFVNFVRTDGNVIRQIIMLTCSLLYFLRLAVGMFVFVKRNIGWFEGGLVSVLFFMLFYLFGVSAGVDAVAIGWRDVLGVALFVVGSWTNSLADYQRWDWKRRQKNGGRLYTDGLFRYAMHINYFGDSVCYFGLALIAHEWICLLVAAGIAINFMVIQIPMLDRHLRTKYREEFDAYRKKTRRFIPLVY